jgi:hypothetical protein
VKYFSAQNAQHNIGKAVYKNNLVPYAGQTPEVQFTQGILGILSIF